MNENCRIGLHSFGEWEDKGKTLNQSRTCRECGETQQQQWKPEERAPYDPYRDLS